MYWLKIIHYSDRNSNVQHILKTNTHIFLTHTIEVRIVRQTFHWRHTQRIKHISPVIYLPQKIKHSSLHFPFREKDKVSVYINSDLGSLIKIQMQFTQEVNGDNCSCLLNKQFFKQFLYLINFICILLCAIWGNVIKDECLF
jgi:hypothetical protein